MGLDREAGRNLEYLLIQLEFKYTKASKHIDVYWTHKLLGIVSRHSGNIPKAIQHFETALSIGETIFVSQEKQNLNKSLIGNPQLEHREMSVLYLKYGQSLYEANSFKRAYKMLKQALIALIKTEETSKIAKAHYLLGYASLKLQKVDKASMNIERALKYYRGLKFMSILSLIHI